MTKSERLYRWIQRGQRQVWLGYGALSLAILLPLLLPGYILTLDLVFTPSFSWPQHVTNTYPLDVALWLLQWALPGDVIEKIILFVILLCSGVGMHLLVQSLRAPRGISIWSWHIASTFAGLFYMINPFTYSRFMAGQWTVLLGYALLPFFVRQLIKCRSQPSVRSFGILALWMLLIITVSLHHAGMMAVLIAIFLAIVALQYRHTIKKILHFLAGMGASLAAVVLLSCYWLVPTLSGNGVIGRSIMGFDKTHLAAFATNGNGSLGALGEVVRLQGFWAEGRDLYVLPQQLVPLWGLVFILVWLLVVVGVIKAWHAHKDMVGMAVAVIAAGAIFAATPFLGWLDSFFPLAGGYREPHKFTNFVAFGFALLGAFGVAYALRWAGKKYGQSGQKIAMTSCLLLPIIITPTMLWGFGGQLAPHHYPQEWSEMNTRLKAIADKDTVLFLPWHQYAIYSFSGGRIIANPAEKFFDVPLIASDDPEYKNLPPTTPDATKRAVAEIVKHPDDIGERLHRLEVGYILLAKEQDWVRYGYLDSQDDINVIAENTNLKLYRIEEK